VEIQAEGVSVDGPRGPLLRPTSLRLRDGERVLVAGDPGAGHTALALCLAGQLRPGTGEVRLDGSADPAELRRRIAVVDAPQVSEPDDGLSFATVVGEELAFAGLPADRRAVAAWIAGRGLQEYAREHIEHVPADVRTAVLTDIAAARPGVRALILDTPDRHAGDPGGWWRLAGSLAERGFAVAVLCTLSSARVLGEPAVLLGEPAAVPGVPQ
jgi:ABC-type cobalamin/Fe3+-siderophores transport system ATPase subunit